MWANGMNARSDKLESLEKTNEAALQCELKS